MLQAVPLILIHHSPQLGHTVLLMCALELSKSLHVGAKGARVNVYACARRED